MEVKGKKNKPVHVPFSKDKVPNSFFALASGFFITLIISIILIVFIYFISSFLNGPQRAGLIVKYCVSLIFWIFLSGLPIIGLYFLIFFPLQSIVIVNSLNLESSLGSWIVFILFYLIAIFLYLFNTSSQFLLLKEEYMDEKLKRTNKICTILIFAIFTTLGIIFIFISNEIFTLILNFIDAW